MLELGCGNGLHSLALAQYLPESRCIGVDFARPAIERGEQILREAGLRNVELICRSLEEPIEGEFDYIIAHGVFSWVPERVRLALLDICRKHLALGGVAFVSFNALPGWKTQQGLRELAFRTVGQPADAGGVERARKVFDALAQTWSGGLGLNTWHASARAAAAPNRRLFHDDLAEINDPYYLTDFVQLAKQHGLSYVCDAQWPLGHWAAAATASPAGNQGTGAGGDGARATGGFRADDQLPSRAAGTGGCSADRTASGEPAGPLPVQHCAAAGTRVEHRVCDAVWAEVPVA